MNVKKRKSLEYEQEHIHVT